MEPSSKEEKAAPSHGMQLALTIGSLATMVALMYWSYIYPYPDGKVPSLAFFVAFWFKEIILLGLVALVFVAAFVGWISSFLRDKRSEDIG
jgi:hypothetical protein